MCPKFQSRQEHDFLRNLHYACTGNLRETTQTRKNLMVLN